MLFGKVLVLESVADNVKPGYVWTLLVRMACQTGAFLPCTIQLFFLWTFLPSRLARFH